MANTVKLKRGSGSDPTASDLVLGELAIRTDNGKIFLKKDDNSVAEVSGGGGIDDGDKGDITVSNSGDTWTIDSGAIDNANINASAQISLSKLEVITSNRIVGNDSGNAVPKELSASDVRTIINVEDGATADQTKSDIDALGIAASTATTLATARTIAGTSFDGSANIDISYANLTNKLSVGDGGLTQNNFTNTLKSKLDGIASGATNVTNTNQLTNGAGFITATLTEEQVEDYVGGMVTGNTETGITVTYQDSDGTLDFVVASQTDNNFTTTLKNKLDGIESGATADQTASEILTLIKTVDGSGSGLDADTLDGVSSGSFLRSDADDTCNGILSIAGNYAVDFISGNWTGNTSGGTGKIQSHDSALYICGGDNGIRFREHGTDRWYIDGSGHFRPHSDSTYNIGSDSHRVSNGYFDTLYGDGSNLTSLPSQTDNNFTTTLKNKLDGIAAGATNVSNTNQLTNGAGFITATLTEEQVEDYVGGMVTGNTETGITVTYQDSDGTLDFVVASQTDNNFTTTLKNKLDGIASGATNVTNNNQLTNGAGYITSASANDGIFWENDQAVSSNYTITNNKNAMSAGPITINSGVTVTVGSGENWTIV